MEKLETFKYKRVLIFTAHPDDLEGFVGGLVKKISRRAQVVSVIFSKGDKGRWEYKYRIMSKKYFGDLRIKESLAAKKILGIDKIEELGFKDRKIPINKNVYDHIVELIEKVKPDLILSFEYNKTLNFYLHPDHMAVAINLEKVIFKHKFRQKFDYLVFNTLLPNRYIDISRVEAVKRRALKFHKTQTRLNRELFFLLDLLPTRIMGFLYGTKYVEVYRNVRINRWNKY